MVQPVVLQTGELECHLSGWEGTRVGEVSTGYYSGSPLTAAVPGEGLSSIVLHSGQGRCRDFHMTPAECR